MTSEHFWCGLARFDDARMGYRIIELCKGTQDGRAFYAFIGIEPHNLRYFLDHYRAGELHDFAVFGRELLRGWGVAPPEDIIEYMRRKYNVEFSLNPAQIERIAVATAQMLSGDQAQILQKLSPFLNDNPQDTSVAVCKAC